jgi:hypothetical protein
MTNAVVAQALVSLTLRVTVGAVKNGMVKRCVSQLQKS